MARWVILALPLLAGLSSACGEFTHRPAYIRPLTVPPPMVVGPQDEFLGSESEPSLTRTAKNLLGTPYHWGGASPQAGFDCSGLVYYVYARHGRAVPRTAEALFDRAHPVAFKAMQPGDLVFFRLKSRDVSHVGIYLGDYLFIHAPSTGKNVTYASLLDTFWRDRFAGGGRL